MTTTEIIAVIGGFVGIISLCIAIATFISSRKKDTYSNGEKDAEIKGDVKYMRNSFDELRFEVKDMNRKQDQINERLTRVEESCKQAHKRIDSLEHAK